MTKFISKFHKLLGKCSLKQFFKYPRLCKSFAPAGKKLCLFKLNVDFLQAVKVMKSSHHLSHDQASKGHGSIPRLTSKPDLHRRSLCKHACKEVCDFKRGIDPYSLLAQSWTR